MRITVSPPEGLFVTRMLSAETASVCRLVSMLFDWPSTITVSSGCQTRMPVIPSLNRKASGRSYSEIVTAIESVLLAIFMPCTGEKLLQIKQNTFSMEKSDENELNPRHPELWDEPDFIRHELARTMYHIYSHGMTTTSGGNMSLADSLGNIWMTPSGTDKGSLKPDEVVCVAPDGNFDGPLKPSMEYPLHRAVYNARPDIGALIHAHPPMLTSFSIVHRVPDTSITGAWREACGTIGYAGYATPGSDAMADKVASEFMKGHNAVIMENHAVVTGGKDMTEALARLEALENCARTIHAAGSFGENIVNEYFTGEGSEIIPGQQSGNSGLEPEAREGVTELSPEEDHLAEEISRIAVRACNRGLFYGFCGTISARSTG
ncbi:class II aldolase/adducin family protein, partial [bacterium]|nr:class II aldolase/adducin family protein [bacterium]